MLTGQALLLGLRPPNDCLAPARAPPWLSDSLAVGNGDLRQSVTARVKDGVVDDCRAVRSARGASVKSSTSQPGAEALLSRDCSRLAHQSTRVERFR